jgi:hypothetical protein
MFVYANIVYVGAILYSKMLNIRDKASMTLPPSHRMKGYAYTPLRSVAGGVWLMSYCVDYGKPPNYFQIFAF